MMVIRATGKAALVHLIDSHFMNWVAIQGNHKKPIREDFFKPNYCWALEASFKGCRDSATVGLGCSDTPCGPAQGWAGRRKSHPTRQGLGAQSGADTYLFWRIWGNKCQARVFCQDVFWSSGGWNCFLMCWEAELDSFLCCGNSVHREGLEVLRRKGWRGRQTGRRWLCPMSGEEKDLEGEAGLVAHPTLLELTNPKCCIIQNSLVFSFGGHHGTPGSI